MVVTDGQLQLNPGLARVGQSAGRGGHIAMNFSELFIKRPVTTTLLQVAIVIFGIVGYRALPVSDLPTVDFPTISVSAGLPGASPETMAAAVATPLEKQFSSIAGIASISSTSSQGSTSITLQFDLDRSIDAAAQDVESAIAKTLRQLPPNMPAPPSYQKVNPADSPILYLTLSSKMLPLSQVDEYAETLIGQRISMVSGVALVSVFGAQKYAVRLDVDPHQLAARAIGIDELAQAVQSANVNQPTGTLYGPDRTFTVNTAGQLTEAAAYRPLIVAYRNGRPVRLDDVAHVYDGVENDKTASWYNADRAIYLSVQRQPGSNTVEIVDNIRALLPQLQAQLPASVQLLDSQRPIAVDPRLRQRHQVHADPDDRAGRAGDLPVPAESVRDAHSQPGAAGVDRRHLRGDGPARLQPGQPVADGADALRRLRR